MSQTPISYALRLAPAARESVDAERDRLLTERGVDAAVHWLQTVDTALSSLTLYPERCPIARESILLPYKVRQLLLPSRRPQWRLLFTVHAGGDDAPTVRVHLLRHTAQTPLAEWPSDADDDL